jgi:hypothetical protein
LWRTIPGNAGLKSYVAALNSSFVQLQAPRSFGFTAGLLLVRIDPVHLVFLIGRKNRDG